MHREEEFPATLEAALERLEQVRPENYTRTRNHLSGAVTRLSPYLTHGFLGVPQVLRHIPDGGKLAQELAWREYFQHVWDHLGDGIHASLRTGPLPDKAYARELPEDIRQARTGVPAIDRAVRTLYNSGYLHNQARLWLASYIVHVRKVHWKSGAEWMWAHLLDGDLASNHLSWQWVAGTGSAKPYVANAENVARFAPRSWHSSGTAIDRDSAAMEDLAYSPQALGPERYVPAAADEPPLLHAPPSGRFVVPDPAAVRGRDVWLVHPWSLANPPSGYLPLGVCAADWHGERPWNARRWRFVTQRMCDITPVRWYAPAAAIVQALAGARSVRGWNNGHLPDAYRSLGLTRAPRGYTEPDRRCHSFSAFWSAVGPVMPHVPRELEHA